MENIYDYAVQCVKDGQRFKLDYTSKSLTVGKKKIIADGKFEGSLGICNVPEEEALCEIERLYESYKRSMPSERSERKRKKYFYSLPEHKLEIEDMCYGEEREVAQIKLELYVMCCALNGSIKLSGCGWFWQSEKDKDLVILKTWL